MDQATIEATLLAVAHRRWAGPRSVRLVNATELNSLKTGHILVGVFQVGGPAPMGVTHYLGCPLTPEPDFKGTFLRRDEYNKLIEG